MKWVKPTLVLCVNLVLIVLFFTICIPVIVFLYFKEDIYKLFNRKKSE